MTEQFPTEWGERRRRREEERQRQLAEHADAPAGPDGGAARSNGDASTNGVTSRRELRQRASQDAPAEPRVSQPRPSGDGRGVTWSSTARRTDSPTTQTARVNVPTRPPTTAGSAPANGRTEQPVRSRRQLREATGERPQVGITPPPVTGGVRRLGPDGRLAPVEPAGGTSELPSAKERSQALRAQAERARVEREQVAQERVRAAQQRAARERLERERAEQTRSQEAHAARSVQERAELTRRAEAERAAREQAARERAEQLARERAEAERVERERAEAAAREQAELERLTREQAALERAERARAMQAEQAARERAERAARARAEQAERERLTREQAAREAAELAAQAESERERAQQLERQRAEQAASERAERARAAQEEQAARERARREVAERERALREAAAEARGAEAQARERGAAAARMVSRPQAAPDHELPVAIPLGTVSAAQPTDAVVDEAVLEAARERLAELRAARVAQESEARNRILAAERNHPTADESHLDEPPVSRFGADGADAPAVPLWPALPEAGTDTGSGTQSVVATRRGFGDEADLAAADAAADHDEDVPPARPYSLLHWVALIAVAFVLGMLIVMVITRDAGAATTGAAAPVAAPVAALLGLPLGVS